MTAISFEAELEEIEGWTLLRLPKDESAALPSRGLVMIEGSVNGHAIRTALETDGKGSHWLALPDSLQKSIRAGVGDTAVSTAASARCPKFPKVESCSHRSARLQSYTDASSA